MEYPENFARFYDLIYQHLRDGVDNRFFLDRIRKAKGKVLEIGVGTGRFFIHALEKGTDIYGLDISETMLQVLRQKLEGSQHYRITRQDIRDFSYNFRFSLAIAPFRVMMHLEEKGDQLLALNNVYRHLDRGGEFIFDAFVPDLRQLIEGIDNRIDFEGEYAPGQKIRRTVSTRPELIRQLIRIQFRIEWDEKGGLREETWDTALHFFFRVELEHLIERSAFEEYRILGDYLGNELREDSREFIVICRKTGN